MASWLHNDAEAIYTRGVLANFKNWTMKWATKLAKKHKRPELPLFDSGDPSLEKEIHDKFASS